MHYKNGREAKVGDFVIGLTYNKPGTQVGRVKTVRTSPNPEEVKTCNVTLELASKSPWGTLEEEYTQCDWLLHADDVWAFVVGVAYSPSEQDYAAKVINFSNKWNAPMKELPPHERP
jgi:hypothetical protein